MSILSSANFKKDPPWNIFCLSVHAPATCEQAVNFAQRKEDTTFAYWRGIFKGLSIPPRKPSKWVESIILCSQWWWAPCNDRHSKTEWLSLSGYYYNLFVGGLESEIWDSGGLIRVLSCPGPHLAFHLSTSGPLQCLHLDRSQPLFYSVPQENWFSQSIWTSSVSSTGASSPRGVSGTASILLKLSISVSILFGSTSKLRKY